MITYFQTAYCEVEVFYEQIEIMKQIGQFGIFPGGTFIPGVCLFEEMF